jgi:hypothetical protein
VGNEPRHGYGLCGVHGRLSGEQQGEEWKATEVVFVYTEECYGEGVPHNVYLLLIWVGA